MELSIFYVDSTEANNIVYEIKKHRLAIKRFKVHKTNHHEFVAKFFSQPTFCSLCKEFLWGIGKQGYQCRLCACVVHKKCHLQVNTKCTANNGDLKKSSNAEFAHTFQPKNYYKPTFCDHCGHLLVGFYKQGLQCSACGFNCHKLICANNVPKNCGIKSSSVLNEPSWFLRKSDKKSPEETSNKATRTFATKISINDFNLLNVIGVGSFGRVFLATDKTKNNLYALKVLKKDFVLKNDDVESIITEKDILIKGHQNLFLGKLYCSFQNESYLFFLMEFFNGGDLWFHLFGSKRFDEDRVRFYAAEILSGLQFLHAEGIIYRDLKLDNVVLDSKGHCKICDFGMCKIVGPDGMAETFCGTPDYIAPEIIRGEVYNFSVDFWSFGILLYEMLNGYSPFYGEDEEQLYEKVLRDEIKYHDFISEQSKSIITMLLERDPERRLGMKTSPHGNIRVHPFFNQIDWIKLEKCEIEPPFKPNVKFLTDVSNFDPDFISESVCLSETSNQFLKTFDMNIFEEFDFVMKDFQV